MGYRKLSLIAGWSVFTIAAIIYSLTAEPTGSLWDCGEFITGAYKLEVVHPPGAPIFLMIGRMFTLAAEIFTDTANHPENISYAVNFMSGICTAVAAMMVCWITIIFGKIILVGRDGTTDDTQNILLAGAGLVAGLSTAFCSSIWFSAVEGEVYAMSTMFTTLVVWGMSKWYSLPDEAESDRWIVFSLFMAGLSIGVHLLSLLTLPAMAMLYYLKKYKKHTWKGLLGSSIAGIFVMIFIQYFIIVGVPTVWTWMEFFTVNSLGMPQHSGLIPLVLLFGGIIAAGLYYAPKLNLPELQLAIVAFSTILVAFSTVGVVVIRANVNTPINMNNPSNAMRLLPYLNREQYGERPLTYGAHFDARPIALNKDERYDYVEETGKYEAVDNHPSYEYEPDKKMPFPRISHTDREPLYMEWFNMEYVKDNKGQTLRDQFGDPILNRQPNMADNLKFFFNYQIGWMYVRYFMWNFSGRQNGKQGFKPWDAGKGHWISGIPLIDNMRGLNSKNMTTAMKEDQARNTYYMLPFLFGLLGFIFLVRHRQKEALALSVLFLMTGLAIIIYSNQPPNEPRERDYVLVGSFFTYCIFIGLSVLGLFEILKNKVSLDKKLASGLSIAVIMIAPLLMGFQNYDDNSRADHYGARDYASNFLNSVEKDAIIFTYGDNDTYPLWYAQEVEGIRTDVRVVNLSLIQVDWYINQLRRKVNDSAPIQFSIPREKLRGKLRPQFFIPPTFPEWGRSNIGKVVQYMGQEHPVQRGSTIFESHLPTNQLYIPVDSNAVVNMVAPNRRSEILSRMDFNIPRNLAKGDLALLDIIHSNFPKRPVYFAVTVRRENLLGLENYLQLEGLALRLVPYKTVPSEKYQGLGSLGFGYPYGDKIFDNVINKWKWGNFDKIDMFVDDKYGPSVQSMHYSILRGAESFIHRQQNEQAMQLIDKYFEAFPNYNFEFDYSTVNMLGIYGRAGQFERGKEHAKQLLNNLEEQLTFLDGLPDNVFKRSDSFRQEYSFAHRGSRMLLQLASQYDKELAKEIQEKLGRFGVLQQQQPPQPPSPINPGGN